MTSNSPVWVSDLNDAVERENRIRQSLLRAVVENLKSNRIVVPLFGLAICGMFPQWMSTAHLAGWYCQMLLGLLSQVVVLARFPQTSLTVEDTQKWTPALASATPLCGVDL